MGASSSVDEAQFKTLQNKVNSLQGQVSGIDDLKSRVDNISNAAASAMDYSKVAEAIDKQSTLRESLATQIAKNPGALADNLAVKIGDKNSAILLNLNDKLTTNSDFQIKVADSISSDSVFKTRIKGDKGEPGTIANKDALEDNLFTQGRTMWCADGEMCKLPDKKLGIQLKGSGMLQFGEGFTREMNAGQIAYGRHDGGENGSLNIVGAGKNGEDRLVNVWESLRTTKAIGVGDMPRDWTGANFKRRDGQWTHFDWKDGGQNYIRGRTNIDNGILNISSGKLKLGNWLIFESGEELMFRRVGGHGAQWPVMVLSPGHDRLRVAAGNVDNRHDEVLGNKYFYVNRGGGSGIADVGWDRRHWGGLPSDY
jgi:hypothetical protein